jgi:tetratricopeptide (TPR) repeat protein
VALVLSTTGLASTEVPPPQTPDGILSFARGLLSRGDSFGAATEYQRFLHHYSDHARSAEALEGLGRAYALADRWPDAISVFSRLQQIAPGSGSRHLLGSALYRGQRYGEAAGVLLAPETGDAGSVLGTLALLRLGESEELPAAALPELAEDFRALERKSPGLAGTLAVLPGAGHFYTGRPRDGIVSLVINGAFIWGIYESARREQWALAGVLGFFEVGWYTGNIVSAVNAAHKWNRREEGRFFRLWEEAGIPRWGFVFGPGTAGLGLAWSW